MQGRRVHTLADAPFEAGRHLLRWDGRDASGGTVASGIYFCRIEAGSEAASRKLVRVR